MKISLNWIKEYTDIVLEPEELKERVSVSLTEVENIDNFGEEYEAFLIAEVVDVKKHSNSDKLLIIKLNVGDKVGIKQSVVQICDITVGDKVVFIPVGSRLPNSENVVKKVNLRGVDSEGFVPSGRELELNNNHSTVYKLDSDIEPGANFVEVMDLDDLILEIKNKALTHRPDAFSIEGLAREIAAIQRTEYKCLDWLYNPESIKIEGSDDLPLEIINSAKSVCPRYTAVVIEGVTVEPSPLWLQIRLQKLGIRPINNIVDISNYLMLEIGQPNHAFDYDKVIALDPNFDDKAVITVRLSQAGEKIKTLDDNTHVLDDDTIVIANSEKVLGIAGVMGGKDSEIDESTKRVIFQVENVDMYSVRRTSMKLGIFTDAVTRFSKGLDPNRCMPTLYRGANMIMDLAGGKIASKVLDDYDLPRKSKSIQIDLDLLRNRIGVEIENDEIISLLERLGIDVVDSSENKLTLKIPTFRKDLKIPEDINEEIVRLYGYDKIVPTLPARLLTPVTDDKSRSNRILIKNIMKNLGANEIYSYTFVGSELYKNVNLSLKGAYNLINETSPALKYLRPLLTPSVYSKLGQNDGYCEDICLFEIDKVDPKNTQENSTENKLPIEPWHLSVVNNKSYYHCKVYLDNLMQRLGLEDFNIVDVDKTEKELEVDWLVYAKDMFVSGRIGLILVDNKAVGMIGQLLLSGKSNESDSVSAFEINLDSIEADISDIPKYREVSKYPSVVHDFCFVLNSDVAYASIINAIKSIELSDLISDIECVDIYRESEESENKKVTLRISMQSLEKTLGEDQISKIRTQIIASVKKDTNGELLTEQ